MQAISSSTSILSSDNFNHFFQTTKKTLNTGLDETKKYIQDTNSYIKNCSQKEFYTALGISTITALTLGILLGTPPNPPRAEPQPEFPSQPTPSEDRNSFDGPKDYPTNTTGNSSLPNWRAPLRPMFDQNPSNLNPAAPLNPFNDPKECNPTNTTDNWHGPSSSVFDQNPSNSNLKVDLQPSDDLPKPFSNISVSSDSKFSKELDKNIVKTLVKETLEANNTKAIEHAQTAYNLTQKDLKDLVQNVSRQAASFTVSSYDLMKEACKHIPTSLNLLPELKLTLTEDQLEDIQLRCKDLTPAVATSFNLTESNAKYPVHINDLKKVGVIPKHAYLAEYLLTSTKPRVHCPVLKKLFTTPVINDSSAKNKGWLSMFQSGDTPINVVGDAFKAKTLTDQNGVAIPALHIQAFNSVIEKSQESCGF